MRRSTLLSLGLAFVFASVAVLALREWLDAQHQKIQADLANGQSAQQNLIVVAAEGMDFGDRVTADDLKVVVWGLDRLPRGAFTSIDALVGITDQTARYVISPIAADEPVLSSRVSSPGQRAKLSAVIAPDMRAVSIRVNDVLGVAGFVLPGDSVDVLLTHMPQSRSDTGAYVDLLLQGVKVVAIDQSSDLQSDQPSLVRTVTVEVTPLDAQKLTLAGSIGTLSLALRNVGAADNAMGDTAAGARVTGADLGLTQPVITPAPAATPGKPAPVVVPPKQPVTVEIGVVRDGARMEYQVSPWDEGRP